MLTYKAAGPFQQSAKQSFNKQNNKSTACSSFPNLLAPSLNWMGWGEGVRHMITARK